MNLEEMLNQAQITATARLITIEDVRTILAKAEITCLVVPAWARKYLRLEYLPHSVAKAYSFPASGTGVRCTFTTDGKPKEIQIYRTRVNMEAKSRLLIHGVRSDPTIAEFSHRLQNDILRAWGFSPAHHTMQI